MWLAHGFFPFAFKSSALGKLKEIKAISKFNLAILGRKCFSDS